MSSTKRAENSVELSTSLIELQAGLEYSYEADIRDASLEERRQYVRSIVLEKYIHNPLNNPRHEEES
jgi:hypothetical protein